MTLKEAKEERVASGVPKLAKGDYTRLWFSGFWDGAISGMLRYESRECWFEMIEENESPESSWYRRFAVVKLTDAQIAKENEVHDAFRRHVGTQGDYTRGLREAEIRPNEEHHLFYDKYFNYCQSQQFDSCEVIAWFED